MSIDDLHRHIPKLRALRDRYAKHLEDPRARYFHPDMAELHETYAPIRDELRTATVFADLPARPRPKLSGTSDYNGRGYIERMDIERTVEDITFAVQILEHPLSTAAPISLKREGLFIAGQSFDAMKSVAEILGTATQSILIVDGYVSDATLNLCAGKQSGVIVQILTFFQSANSASPFKTLGDAFNKQFGGLSVRTSRDFHDRFIVIDKTSYFHFGSSIKDVGTRGFMFSRIEEPAITSNLEKALSASWNAATVVL